MRAVDVLGLAGAALIGLLTLTLQPWSTPWWTAVIAAAVIALLAFVHIFEPRPKMFITDAAIVLSAVALIIACVWRFSASPFPGWGNSTTTDIGAFTDRPDLVSMFVRDITPDPGFEVFGCTEYDKPNLKDRIYYKIVGNVAANSKVLVFYIPRTAHAIDIIQTIADEHSDWLTQVENAIHFNNQVQGNTSPVLSKNMVFSNVVYIYHEDILDAVQIGNLTSAFNSRSLVLQLRGHSYVMGAWDAIKAGRIPKIQMHKLAGCRIVPVKSG